MKIMKTIKARWVGRAVAAVLLMISPGANAIQVFADFDGDQVWDASVSTTPGTTLAASLHVSQSAAEVAANGGLASFDLILDPQGGLRLLGTTGADKAANISIDPLWDGFPSATSLGGEQMQVGGNVLFNAPSVAPVVHLFDVSIVAPSVAGTYPLVLADAPGPSFTAGFATYDSTAGFNPTAITVVPLPASLWLLGASLLALFGLHRRGVRS